MTRMYKRRKRWGQSLEFTQAVVHTAPGAYEGLCIVEITMRDYFCCMHVMREYFKQGVISDTVKVVQFLCHNRNDIIVTVLTNTTLHFKSIEGNNSWFVSVV